MDKETKEEFGLMAMFCGLLIVIIVVLIVRMEIINARCKALEIKQEQDMKVIHNRVTNTAGNLQADINNILDWTEINSANISEIKTIIHNTNSALGRTNKKVNSLDKEETATEASVNKPEPIPNSSKEDVEMTEVKASTDGMTYMGTWEISAYEWSDQPCANGNWPTVMHTCAFNEVPFGTTVYVDGLGYFVNEDICGTPGRLDIFLGDVGDCEQFGIQYHDVYIVN